MAKIDFEKDFPRHPLHYFFLLSLMLVGLWGIFWFSYDASTQFAIVVSMAISYVVWGIIHHSQHHDLHMKIVFEYILVSLLAVLTFGSMILRT